MAISDNVGKMADKIKQEMTDNNGVSQTAKDLQSAALKAISGGVDGWLNYMNLFASTPTELARLVPTDGSTEPARQIARAYLVSNGMCTEMTTGSLRDNVGTKLD